MVMKAAQINRYGGSEIVQINQNTPEPALSSGKVLVSIKSAGVNPADWKIREGYLQQMIPLEFPFTLGIDFSGIVKEIGHGVSDFKRGDEVYGQAGVVTGRNGFGKDRKYCK
jgi:NADPH:quinone reductase-like Zn-dependent oxidoreductase